MRVRRRDEMKNLMMLTGKQEAALLLLSVCRPLPVGRG